MLFKKKRSTVTTRATGGTKFGTFDGVFMPTVLTILGAIMYLRTGWVVGHAGLLGAIIIVVLSNLITFTTGLSISSIATNMRVRAGGPFSIISQSVGLEVGASVSVPFYFAQAVSSAFYIFAFAEGWERIFPDHSPVLVVFASFAAAFLIALISVQLTVQVRYPIAIIVGVSLFAIFLGSFPSFGTEGVIVDSPILFNPSSDVGFWGVFAVFFPAVTGLLTGVNMSGTLKNPSDSIPSGTMWALVVTFFIYLALVVWVALVATPEELLNNLTVMVDKSAWGPAVLAGLLAATFSSALNSIVGAPQILQAIAEQDVLPGGRVLARTTASGEPRTALYVTGVIGLLTLVFGLVAGGVNGIAPLMTMIFLATYAVLNGVVLLEQSLGLMSWRPLFRVPSWVPLFGLIGCTGAMFLINPGFGILAIAIILGVYIYLSNKRIAAPWSDIRSGLFVNVASWAAKKVNNIEIPQERAWSPRLLVPVQSSDDLLGSYRFLRALTRPRGAIYVLRLYTPDEDSRPGEQTKTLVKSLNEDGVYTRLAQLQVEEVQHSLEEGMEVLQGTFFRPNTFAWKITADDDEAMTQVLVNRAAQHKMGTLLMVEHPVKGFGRERVINVWIREQSPSWEIGLRMGNLDLTLLLAYQLHRNWQGEINVIMLVSDEGQLENGRHFLRSLAKLSSMPKDINMIVTVNELQDYLSNAPTADINIFGLGRELDLSFTKKVIKKTEASCIFVRSSGDESVLA